ncbi:MAG: tetratricopeptide repeat protein [Burkholderiaceae bacterium]|nr:tetratricopeptide repeat protein [Burkholderiaceae bacterium]
MLEKPRPARRDPLHISPDDPQRSRLFPRGVLFGLGVLCAGTLALVYPGQNLMRLLATSTDNGLAIDYLRHLVDMRGGDVNLRLMLAQRYVHIGKSQAALDALGTLQTPQANALRLQIWKTRWFDARALGHPADAAQARQALSTLLQHSKPDSFTAWRDTLVLLQGLDEPQAVQRLSGMVTQFLPLSAAAAQQAAQLLVGVQANALAARILFDTAKTQVTDAERQRLIQSGATALLASGQPALAYRQTAAALGAHPVQPAMAWFMVKLALGANQPVDAGRWLRQAVRLDLPADQLGKALTPAQRELGWQVLLAGGDLRGAIHIADAALTAEPGNRAWAERRAQVLEWSGQPDAAMQQWIALLRAQFSRHALDELHRLALALYSSSGMDAYWEQRAAHTTLTADEWVQYAQALEVRGHPEQAVRILRQAAVKEPKVLSPLAWLLGNMGEVDASLSTYAEALKRGTLDLRGSIDYAITLLQSGQFEQARHVLEVTQHLPGDLNCPPDRPGAPIHRPPPTATGQPCGDMDLLAAHQSLLGDIAWDMGEARNAEAAYGSIWESAALRERIKPYQLQRFIILTQKSQGDTAALRLLPQAWARAPSEALAQLWLQSLVRQPSLKGIEEWQRVVLDSEAGAPLRQQPEMYAARAQVWRALGRTDLALADLQEALRLSPSNTDNQIALLWMLIDSNQPGALRRDMARYSPSLQGLEDGLDVLSAAAQTLGDTAAALRYSQQIYPRKKTDALWLLNYGDLLAQAGDGRRAQAAYNQSWALLQRPAPAAVAGKTTDNSLNELLARLRLSHDRLDGAGQQALLGQLRDTLRSGTLSSQQTLQANAAIADWLLRLDTTSAARWWLARRVLTPAARQSIALQMALRDGNRDAVNHLLQQGAARHLLPQDKPEAERVAGHPLQALATAEQVLETAAERGQDNPALQALARQTAEQQLALAHRATVTLEHRQIDNVVRQGPVMRLSLQLGGALRLQAQASRQSMRSNNAAALTGVPSTWSDAQMGLQWQGEHSQLSGALTHNTAVGTLNGWRIGGGTQLPGNIRAQVEAEHNAVADESGLLQLAGGRDRLQLRLSRDFGRVWANVSTAVMTYDTRLGNPLGHGASTQFELGFWFRRSEPDLSVKLLGYSNRFSANAGPPLPAYAPLLPGGVAPNAALFIPAGDDVYGLGFGFNMAHGDTYTRRWLPYAEVDVLQSRRLGLTNNLNLGIHGPVFGPDELSLTYQRQQNTSGLNRQWSVQYRLWFGR